MGIDTHAQGFPRRHRLTRPEEFERVFSGGCRSTAGPFAVLSLPNGLPFPRLGLAVAKRHVKRAVDRNWLKRQIRESFRCGGSAVSGRDLIVMVRGTVDNWDPKRLRGALDAMWQSHALRCVAS